MLILDFARKRNRIKSLAVDSLADGGAQLINSFGRDTVKKIFPGGLKFDLSESELTEVQKLFNDKDLMEITKNHPT